MSLTPEQIDKLTALRDHQLNISSSMRMLGLKDEAEWKAAVAIGIQRAAKELDSPIPPPFCECCNKRHD